MQRNDAEERLCTVLWNFFLAYVFTKISLKFHGKKFSLKFKTNFEKKMKQ